MKSIKEKAEEYGYTNWQSDEYHDCASEGLDFDPIGHTQKTFEAGANYVLDAIIDVINQPMNDYLILGELKKVILQLKK